MCGITGIYAFNLVGGFSMINLSKATTALERRGPDFQDTYHDESVGLGHRRLSIIDISEAAHQPMTDASGRYIIVFNGEIYNYRVLKQELEAKGYTFRSTSDTEVLLQLYIAEGKESLQKLDGFFALAIYDKAEKSLFIARDRIGIKPLYYYHDEDKLLFASELKSLLAYGIEKEIDFTSLYLYLQFNYIMAPATILKGVKKLMPGSYLYIKEGQVQEGTYYQIPYDRQAAQRNPMSYTQQKEHLKLLLEESVQRRLVSDVSLGAFLSGGIDSSVITALASRHKPDLLTFSVGYKEEKFFDETAYAQEVSKKFNTSHTVFSLSNDDLYAHVTDIMDYLDEPFADSSAIAVYILSREVGKMVKVALSGDGADEIFTGYNKHAAFYKVLNGGISGLVIRAFGPVWAGLPRSRNNRLTNTFRQLDRYSKGAALTSRERYWSWAGFTSEVGAMNLMSASARERLSLQAFEARKEAILKYIPDKEIVSDLLYTDVHMVLTNDMLTKVDLMSMANSLEVRVPFLDHKVVEFAFSIPDDSKINGSMRKRILQDAFRDILPENLYNRPKKGFEVPMLKWLRREMKSKIINDLLEDDFVREQGIFQIDEVRRLKKQLFSSNPGDVHARVWGLLVFQHWWKRYFKT